MRIFSLPAEEHRADDDDLQASKKMETSFRLDWCEPEKTHHQDDRAVLADGVQEDLCDGLTRRRSDGGIVILNREEQAEDEEPSEDRGDTDGHDNAYRSRHGRVMRLFCHVRARVEPYSKHVKKERA